MTMIKAEQIIVMLQEELIRRDLFLVDVLVHPGNRIMVYADSMKGISLDECMALSRYLGTKLEQEGGDFELEVSSPGLDKPLKLPQQYLKNIGRLLEVVTFDGIKTTGRLVMADGEIIRLELEIPGKGQKGQKKPKETLTWERNLKEIKTAKVVISLNNRSKNGKP